LEQGQAMGQRLQSWQSAGGERLWLSMLVDAMEQAASAEFRAIPCDSAILMAVSAQLARPASPYPFGGSNFSLRN
jgi:biotin-(acetyl-CoA carboxylase) ligase